jgi:hypothetical protein
MGRASDLRGYFAFLFLTTHDDLQRIMRPELLMMTRSKTFDPAISRPQLDIPPFQEAFDLLLRIFIVGARQVDGRPNVLSVLHEIRAVQLLTSLGQRKVFPAGRMVPRSHLADR